MGRELVAEHEPEAVLARVLEAARELTGARYAALGVLDRQREGLERFVTSGIDESTREAIGDLPHGRGILGLLIDEPRPLRLRRLGDHPRSYGFPPHHPPMTSFLGVPVFVGSEVYGNLYLTDKGDGEFDQADEDAAVVLAEWASVAIVNARLYDDLRAQRDELAHTVAVLEAATGITRLLAEESDPGRILELVVKRGRALIEARALVAALVDGEELVVVAAAGEGPDQLADHRIPVRGSIGGYVLHSGRSQQVRDAGFTANAWLAARIGAVTELVVPMVFRGRPVGILAALDRLRGGPEFSREDERVIEAFASAAATAVGTQATVAHDRAPAEEAAARGTTG